MSRRGRGDGNSQLAQIRHNPKFSKKELFVLAGLMGFGAYLGWWQLQSQYGTEFVNSYVYNCGIPEVRDDSLCDEFNQELFGIPGLFIGQNLSAEFYLMMRAIYKMVRLPSPEIVAPKLAAASYGSGGVPSSPSSQAAPLLPSSSEPQAIVIRDPLLKTQLMMTVISGFANMPKYVLLGLTPTFYRMFGFLTDILSVEENRQYDQIICWVLYAAATVVGLHELRKDHRSMQMVWRPNSRLTLMQEASAGDVKSHDDSAEDAKRHDNYDESYFSAVMDLV
jgi:hypothetical protein